MATVIDWQGSHNALRAPMEETLENGFGIMTYTRNALYAFIGNADPGFNIIFLETDAVYDLLCTALGVKGGTDTTKQANTDNVVAVYAKMKVNLDHFDDLIRPVFGKNTLQYKTIWGANRNRFYRGSYEQIESALNSMAEAMANYTGLTAVIAAVNAYHNECQHARQDQQGLITNFRNQGADVYIAMEACILQMDRNLGWLKFFYALQPDAQAKVNSFFDITKIMHHSHNKIYVVHVPKGGFAAVCRHQFIATDRVIIKVDGPEDAYVGLSIDSHTSCDPATAFLAASSTVTDKLAGEIFPDFTNKQVIVLNTSQTTATHITFEIVEE